MEFSEKLVKLRKIKGITQDEMASAVGVSRQAVYKWESGQSYPEVPKLIELHLLFGISIDDLLDDAYAVVIPETKKRPRTKTAEPVSVIQHETNEEEKGNTPEAMNAPISAPAVKEEEIAE
ncbi:MAG: helix-turn-helix transcriptional regulator, partial [Firmicutes bacterium]|nr:helix-turn-helix transcriptional regulator [Candidatus Colimorpha enterica]